MGAPPLSFATWGNALETIERLAVDQGPLTLILDEFQYLAAGDPALESTIQKFWDRWDANRTPIMLVLCGSALSFMAGLLSGGRPTFGRSVYRPLLLPLTYKETVAFTPGDSPVDLIERFAVLGGSPQYQIWAGQRPLHEVITKMILPTDAPLHSDPEHLIREEGDIREPGPYFGVLVAIAAGYTTTTAIGGHLGLKQQLANSYLARLELLGYIHRAEPVAPRGANRARTYWTIKDPFMRFWFRYVFPNRSRLSRGRIPDVAKLIKSDLPTYVGGVFEDCCREWIGRYSSLGATAVDVGSWWSRKHDVEIDVATVNKTGYELLGSCKWWSRAVGVNVLDDLYRAKSVLGPFAAQSRLAIFSRSGFTRALVDRANAEQIALVEPSNLFQSDE